MTNERKIQISIEEVQQLLARCREINALSLNQIEWTENGQVLSIDPEIMSRFELCGLNNVDFVGAEYWKNRVANNDG